MKHLKYFALSFILLLLAGCTQNPNGAMTAGIGDMFAPSDVTCDPPGENPCQCYVCEQHPSVFSWMYIRSSLLGEKCSFEACGSESYSDLLSDYHFNPYEQLLSPAPKIPRFFSFGMGPDFSSFSEANKYCAYSMDLPVQWLTISTSGEVELPSFISESCFLERTIVPLYVIDNEIGTINLMATYDIAYALGEAPAYLPGDGDGPFYVTTQPNYFMFDSGDAGRVREQIQTIKDACPNCLTVLMLPDNAEDMNPEHLQATWKEVLTEVIGTPQEIAQGTANPIYDDIDFIGMGIIITPESVAEHDCNPQFRIYEAANFTYATILKQYQKPSIWAYFGVEEGSAGGCTIDGNGVASSYDYLFQNAQMLAYSGIVGVAHVGFSDDRMPSVVPDDSQFGLVSSITPLVQNNPQLNAWSDDCHYYYSLYDRIASVYSPKGRATHCAFTFNNRMKAGIVHDATAMENSVPQDPPDNKYSCGAQISSSPPPSRYYYGVIPPSISNTDTACTDYPELSAYAGDYSVDPLFVRAVSYVETDGLDSNAKNFVLCESTISYSPGMSGCWRSSIGADNPVPPSSPCSTNTDSGLECGLMGRTELYEADVGECVPADREYNPFNSTNACLGARELGGYFADELGTLENAITSNAQMLADPVSGEMNQEWMKAYLIAYAYDRGSITYAEDAISDFAAQYNLPISGSCSGNHEFINYVNNCAPSAYDPTPNGNTYPSEVIAAYVALSDACY